MPAESAAVRRIDVRAQTRALPDRSIADVARRQHGVVSRPQLLSLGLSRDEIAGRLEIGRLHPVHPGVYAVGHPHLTREGRWIAAVLRGGEGAVLSHASAAALWELQRRDPAVIDVALPRKSRSGRSIRRHFMHLAPDEVIRTRGIPVTTVSRTLLDLSAVTSEATLMRAIREAEVLRLPLRPPLGELVERHRGRRGVATLRRCLEGLGTMDGISRSLLEDRFLALIARAGLPMPETNVALAFGARGFEVDCCWPSRRAIVELDGHEAHGTRVAFEADRERDRRLQAAGWRVVRITWRQLRDDQDALARDLRDLLEG